MDGFIDGRGRAKAAVRRILTTMAFALLASAVATPASAQGILSGLKRSVENAVKRETQRKADEAATEAVQCAMGEKKCGGSNATSSTGNSGDDSNASVDPGGDHPLVTPYAGSKRNKRNFESYTDYRRIIGVDKGRHPITETLEGKLTSILYDNPQGRSSLEIIRNYEQALKARGFVIDYQMSGGETWVDNPAKINGMVSYGQDVRYFTDRLKYGEGTAYVSILVYREGHGFGRTTVQVLETAQMDAGMVTVDESAMAAELDRSGQINLQGVYFDTGKATLKPASADAIEDVVAMMSQRPELKLQIVGHTDSVGNASANQVLSQDRANAVRNALLARGVSADRLVAYGLGSTQPIASNATSEGRAQNRRVMLLRLN